MGRTRRSGRLLALAVTAVVVASVAPSGVVAQDDAEEPPVATRVKGKRQKWGKSRVGDWVAIRDATGDVRTAEGEPFPDAEGYGDISRVLITRARVPRKLVAEWDRSYPIGTADAYRGKGAEVRRRDDRLFLIVETVDGPPRRGEPTLQLVVGTTGADGQPRTPQAGTNLDDGRLQISRSGIFAGTVASGTTDQTGLAAGETTELYNGDSLEYGRIDRRRGRIFHAAKLPEDTRFVTIALESMQGGSQVIDELELPLGTTVLDLEHPWYGIARDEDRLVCRDVRTRTTPPALLGDPTVDADAVWLEMTVELADGVDASSLDGSTDLLDLVAADGSGTSGTVEGTWSVDEVLGTATIRGTLPTAATLWRLDGAATATTGGSRAFLQGEGEGDGEGELASAALLDWRRGMQEAVGDGAFVAAPGMVGRLGGAHGCGRFTFLAAACDDVESTGLVADLGLVSGAIALADVTTAEGFDVCIGADPEVGAPSFIFARRDEAVDPAAFRAEVAASACPSRSLDSAETAFLLDCTSDGFVSLWTIGQPIEGVDAGYNVSVDIALDIGDAISDDAWVAIGERIADGDAAWGSTLAPLGPTDLADAGLEGETVDATDDPGDGAGEPAPVDEG